MDKNYKNFNNFVFLSSFARNLSEVFIGTILFKLGFSLHIIIYYYLLINLFSSILDFPCVLISKKYSNNILSILGILSFIALQLSLSFVTYNIIWIYIISFLFALYRRCYWMARRYYTLQVLDKKDIPKKYSFVSIANQLAVMFSSYIGALLLQFVSIDVITIISIVLLLLSIYFVMQLKFETEKNDTKINLIETFKCTPKSSILHIACYELLNVLKFLLPLYLIIYVKDTYTTVGLVTLLIEFSTLIFIYVYGRLINKDKNYLKLSIIFVVLIRILQVNSVGITLMIASFLLGFANRMYEQSLNKEYVILSKQFEYHNYNFMYEIIQNTSRLFVVSILFFFTNDVRIMIYIVLLFISLGLLVDFKTEALCDNSEVLWKEK